MAKHIKKSAASGCTVEEGIVKSVLYCPAQFLRDHLLRLGSTWQNTKKVRVRVDSITGDHRK